jgi:hypothetical protein
MLILERNSAVLTDGQKRETAKQRRLQIKKKTTEEE